MWWITGQTRTQYLYCFFFLFIYLLKVVRGMLMSTVELLTTWTWFIKAIIRQNDMLVSTIKGNKQCTNFSACLQS